MKRASVQRVATEAEACKCCAIRRAARRVTQLYDDILAPTGLRVTQYSLLANVDRYGSIPMTELAEVLEMNRTTLTRNVAPLHRMKLLSIRPSGHGRTKLVSLTPEGRVLLRKTRPYWKRAEAKLSESFGVERTRDLIALAKAVEAAPF